MSLLQSRLGLSVCQRMSLWRTFPNKSLKGWSPSCCVNRRETFIPHKKLSTRTSLIPYRLLSGTLLSRNLSSFSRNVLSCKVVGVNFKTFDNKSVRFKSSVPSGWRQRNQTVMMYVLAGAILVVGFSYAAVPLYTVFCQATGLGGEVQIGQDADKVGSMSPVAGRPLVIRFNADTAASMRWNFKPQQTEIKVFPGETALAFYSAINPTDKPIIGISTYNVVPFDAGQYFNKIQCFCFEEQRLNPHEQVDMPVFFYIDPEFAEDPKMGKVDSITLSYTFFEAKEGLVLPDPYAKA